MFVGFFDEPMSHCDLETRQKFYKAITNMPGKTIVSVIHDHHYLHHFNRVVVIKDGSVFMDLRDAKSIQDYEQSLSEKENAVV